MDAQSWKQDSLIDFLLKEPGKFDFFQAVRLLLLATKTLNKEAGIYTHNYEIGHAYQPGQEAIRFRVQPSYNFPLHTITAISWSEKEERERQKQDRYEMVVTILGLIGAKGILPDHYNDLIMQRIKSHDYAMRDFLDLFHHRTLSLLYRAWEKYRFPICFERQSVPRNHTSIQTVLKSFYGGETAYLKNRLSVQDEVFIFYTGFLSRGIRPSQDIERILQAYFDVPVFLEQFQKEYLFIPQNQLTRIGRSTHGQFHQLAKNAILGRKIKSLSNCFRLTFGPLTLKQFRSLLPCGTSLKQVHDLVRYFVGLQFNFDIQLILKAQEVPKCQLLSKASFRLGYDTWFCAKTSQKDRKDLILKIKS